MRSSKRTCPEQRETRVDSWRGLAVLLAGLFVASASAADLRVHEGCCDASAAAPVNAELFAAASDEDNQLRLFGRQEGGPAVATLDVSAFLDLRRRDEADLEGAARMGGTLYWIGSHSRNSDAQPRPGRHVLFATTIRGDGSGARLQPAGRPFMGLVSALGAEPGLASLDLPRAAQRAGEAPGGLNIEGLAAGPGESLLIGFRSPVPEGLALVVPLLNPGQVIDRAAPRFGAPSRLPLGGLGIRGMARAGSGILILAGPAEGGGRHRLYHWKDAGPAPTELPGVVPRGFQAESLLVDDSPGARGVDLLSDDGGEKRGGRRCEEIQDTTRRAFRALRTTY